MDISIKTHKLNVFLLLQKIMSLENTCVNQKIVYNTKHRVCCDKPLIAKIKITVLPKYASYNNIFRNAAKSKTYKI